MVINRQWSSLNVFSLKFQTGSAILVGDTSHYIPVVSPNPQHFSHISHNPCQEKEKKRTWEQTVKLHLRPFVPHRHKAILRCFGWFAAHRWWISQIHHIRKIISGWWFGTGFFIFPVSWEGWVDHQPEIIFPWRNHNWISGMKQCLAWQRLVMK